MNKNIISVKIKSNKKAKILKIKKIINNIKDNKFLLIMNFDISLGMKVNSFNIIRKLLVLKGFNKIVFLKRTLLLKLFKLLCLNLDKCCLNLKLMKYSYLFYYSSNNIHNLYSLLNLFNLYKIKKLHCGFLINLQSKKIIYNYDLSKSISKSPDFLFYNFLFLKKFLKILFFLRRIIVLKILLLKNIKK